MNEINYPETNKHVIAHNQEKYTYFLIEPQNCFSTGQPFMEIFETIEEAKQAFPQAFPEPVIEEPLLNIEDLNIPSPLDLVVE